MVIVSLNMDKIDLFFVIFNDLAIIGKAKAKSYPYCYFRFVARVLKKFVKPI